MNQTQLREGAKTVAAERPSHRRCRGWDCGDGDNWSHEPGGGLMYWEMVIGEENVVEKTVPRFDNPPVKQIQKYVSVPLTEIG